MNIAHVLSQLSQGDDKAFRIIYDMYYSRVAGICRRIIQDRDNAQDCLQEIFTLLWVHRDRMCASDDFNRYFMRSAVNRAYNWRRDHLERKASEARAAASLEKVTDGYVGLVEQDWQTINAHVTAQVVNVLPKRQRQTYLLSRRDGFKAKAIAKRLKITEGSVQNTLTNVLREIRIKLNVYLVR
jgi:RNA polymerase sigma factor (sigma-70 family)